TSFLFFFSSRRRHTRLQGDWSSDVCSSDLDRSRLATLTRPFGPPSPRGRGLSARLERTVDPRLSGEPFEFSVFRFTPSLTTQPRSEERRVGKECRSRGSADY